MKLNYFIYLKLTINATGFILGFIRFYIPCSSTLIMEEYDTLSCIRGYQRVWMAAVREQLWNERERPQNPTYSYAVVVKKDIIIVGKSTW